MHWLLSQSKVSARPSVLWCYKKDLGFTSHRKKRENKIKKEIKRGIREANTEDPFELFVGVTDIRYTYYKETHKILGNTYGMCVLQDFEAITPNLLARTIETVEGGGIVVLLLKTMKSLKQLYTMSMDVHLRYRTESSDDVIARFNERFILSLGHCENCLVVDDELNVLPISAGKDVKALKGKPADSEDSTQLKDLKESLQDTQPAGALVAAAKTMDQAKAILTFIEAISEKTLSSTVTLTASRGRGKSAALGIAIAAAIGFGYSNIFVTSPSPENLKTVFQFIFKGFDALKYEEHLDYEIIQSTNPDFNKAIVRVNVFKSHRQTIQYIQPEDAHVLGQAELVVIDEAAAIPLPLVRNLIGPYLVFMASTINGYEGTGRSLSLKLIQQLREQSRGFVAKQSTTKETAEGLAVTRQGKADKKYSGDEFVAHRKLREIKLDEPIRYGPNDPVESWLNKVLCLNATTTSIQNTQGCPHPSQCELYYVNRDTLFSYHPASEAFLQRMMALYVASHYKNSPNDLILLADAPQHVLFVLLPPINEDNANVLPEPLCVVQVALEGNISRQTVMNNLSKGLRQGGDLIPWLISQQYQDEDFAGMSGARVVRIATHPDYIKMGYGSRSLELLEAFYRGDFTNLDERDDAEELALEEVRRIRDVELENADLHSERIGIKDATKMPPLLLRLSEKKAPANLDYMGVSYGLTPQLHKFWKRSGYVPVYLRQTPNELTGEHTCVMIKTLAPASDSSWLGAFAQDFHRRFSTLLSFQFRKFQTITALSILEAAEASLEKKYRNLSKTQLDAVLTPFDLKRLESYANSMVDHHLILDLIPTLASLYFERRLGPDMKLSGVQSSILLAIGQQRKTVEDIERELDLKSNQILALFMKVVKKMSTYFHSIQAAAVESEMPSEYQTVKQNRVNGSRTNGTHVEPAEGDWQPMEQTLDDDLEEAGNEVKKVMREKQRELINSLDLSKYAIGGSEDAWAKAQEQVAKERGTSSLVSVPTDPESSQQAKAKRKHKGAAREIAAEEAAHAKKKKVKVSKKAR